MKIVLCGPPHVGKSCLRFGLKEAIRNLPNSPYPYFITACPDGEGSWFQETAERNSGLAIKLKSDYKSKFTDTLVTTMAEWVENCSLSLALIDIGGIPDEKNEIICRHATHSILLAGKSDDFITWRNFCGKLKLLIIAEIISDYTGKKDRSLSLCEDGIYRGSVHYLERGDLSIKERLTVKQLAQIIVKKAVSC